jgi:hypothetical protein
MRTRRLGLSVVLLTVGAVAPYAQAQKPPPAPPAAAAAMNLTVTVTYTGKGPVDAGHGILIFLFAEPNISAESQPLGPPQIIQKSGGSATFTNVTASPVYIAVVYNESGTYDGSGPPAPGTPVAVHSKDVKDPNSPALPVTPGPKTAVRISFSDARRFGG